MITVRVALCENLIHRDSTIQDDRAQLVTVDIFRHARAWVSTQLGVFVNADGAVGQRRDEAVPQFSWSPIVWI